MKIKNKVGLSALAILAGVTLVVPGVRAAQEAKNVTVNVTVADGISLTVNKNEVNLGSLVPGSTQQRGTGDVTATVATNKTTGWELSISDTDTTVTLANGSDNFVAFSGTYAGSGSDITAETSNDVWGYKLSSWNTNNYAGLPASNAPQKIKEVTGSATGGSETVTLVAATKPGSTLPAGTYTGSITFTAITK